MLYFIFCLDKKDEAEKVNAYVIWEDVNQKLVSMEHDPGRLALNTKVSDNFRRRILSVI